MVIKVAALLIFFQFSIKRLIESGDNLPKTICFPWGIIPQNFSSLGSAVHLYVHHGFCFASLLAHLLLNRLCSNFHGMFLRPLFMHLPIILKSVCLSVSKSLMSQSVFFSLCKLFFHFDLYLQTLSHHFENSLRQQWY